jgi:hypothetical protein
MITCLMTLLPFLLAAEPAAPPAESAESTAEAPEPAASPTPAPTSAPASVAEGPEPAPSPTLSSTTPTTPSDAPRPPRFRGIGLMTTAGIFGAVGLGANIGRIITVRSGCKDTAGDPQGCITNAVSLVALSPIALISNITAFGLASGAGRMHGRYLAHRTAYANDRTRRAGVQIGVGAGLMALGILGYLGTRVGSFVDVFGAASCANKHPVDESGSTPPEFGTCLRGKWSGYLAGILITQSASIVGVGLLSHGATYQRTLRRFRARTDARLTPSFGPTYAGLSLAGRF